MRHHQPIFLQGVGGFDVPRVKENAPGCNLFIMRLQGPSPRDAFYYISEPFFQNNAAVGTLKMAQRCNIMRLRESRRLDSTKRCYRAPRGIPAKTRCPSRNAAWGLHGHAIFSACQRPHCSEKMAQRCNIMRLWASSPGDAL